MLTHLREPRSWQRQIEVSLALSSGLPPAVDRSVRVLVRQALVFLTCLLIRVESSVSLFSIPSVLAGCQLLWASSSGVPGRVGCRRDPRQPLVSFLAGVPHLVLLLCPKCWIFLETTPSSCCCCCLVTKSCLTLCEPVDCSLPGSSVHGIFQARILEWVAIPSPGNLPAPGIDLAPPASQADSLPLSHLGSRGALSINSKGDLIAGPVGQRTCLSAWLGQPWGSSWQFALESAVALLPEADQLPAVSDPRRFRPFSQVAVHCPLSQNPVVPDVAENEVLGRPCHSRAGGVMVAQKDLHVGWLS